jgi:maltodextrin utilization protein YvdJ
VAHGEGSQFKPQYRKNKQTNKTNQKKYLLTLWTQSWKCENFVCVCVVESVFMMTKMILKAKFIVIYEILYLTPKKQLL